MQAESQLPAGACLGGVFPWQHLAGGMDRFCRDRLLPGLAGDEDRGFICMGNNQEDALSSGLFKQVIQNVLGNPPVGLLESLQEYILRGSARWC